MKIEDIRKELWRLSRLIEGWSTPKDITPIERDLVLEKLRALYDAVRFSESADAARNTSEPATDRESVEGIELDDILFAEPGLMLHVSLNEEPAPMEESEEEPKAKMESKPEAEIKPEPTPEPEPEFTPQAGAANLFGMEETSRHRHKQRVIMSFYGTDESDERPVHRIDDNFTRNIEEIHEAVIPAVEALDAIVAASANDMQESANISESSLRLDLKSKSEPELKSEPEPDTEPEPLFAPDFSAETDDTDPASASAASSPSGSVLGEVMNHDQLTLADMIAPQRSMASELRRSEAVGDLRRAMGLNDKFLLVRDLFGGDMEECDTALEILNGFDNLDDCMIHIAEHYVWNPHSDGAKLMMELLERKYA